MSLSDLRYAYRSKPGCVGKRSWQTYPIQGPRPLVSAEATHTAWYVSKAPARETEYVLHIRNLADDTIDSGIQT